MKSSQQKSSFSAGSLWKCTEDLNPTLSKHTSSVHVLDKGDEQIVRSCLSKIMSVHAYVPFGNWDCAAIDIKL